MCFAGGVLVLVERAVDTVRWPAAAGGVVAARRGCLWHLMRRHRCGAASRQVLFTFASVFLLLQLQAAAVSKTKLTISGGR